mmetsp:Transcript_29283/g.93955  ORF Transcript_29283/g.93955 Transcript_29283/m.93955 type:complete len:249 (+) Transcript_29283:301-1047(+)
MAREALIWIYAPVANSSYSGMVVIVVWQLLMAFFTYYVAAVCQFALTEAEAVPFMMGIALIADALGNMLFMTISIKSVSFWGLLALEFVLLVARDADLWGMTHSRLKDLMQYPDQLASVCLFSELTSTMTLICLVMFEIALECSEVGIPQVTLKMTQRERWRLVTAYPIVFAMQLFALAVSHGINERRRKRGVAAQGLTPSQSKSNMHKELLKMWETHGLMMMFAAYAVMGVTASAAILVKSVVLGAS